jgi:hypothetical protein
MRCRLKAFAALAGVKSALHKLLMTAWLTLRLVREA